MEKPASKFAVAAWSVWALASLYAAAHVANRDHAGQWIVGCVFLPAVAALVVNVIRKRRFGRTERRFASAGVASFVALCVIAPPPPPAASVSSSPVVSAEQVDINLGQRESCIAAGVAEIDSGRANARANVANRSELSRILSVWDQQEKRERAACREEHPPKFVDKAKRDADIAAARKERDDAERAHAAYLQKLNDDNLARAAARLRDEEKNAEALERRKTALGSRAPL